MLCGAPSCESTLVSAMPAAREIEVGALPPRGALAPMLSTLMTRPHLRSFICGQTSRVIRMRGEQLLVEVVAPDLVGQIFERAGARRAGIVDDDVDLAERLHRLVVDTLDVGSLGDVAGNAGDPPFATLAPIALTASSSVSRPRARSRRRRRSSRSARDRVADALAAAGDDGAAARKTDVHSTFSLQAPSWRSFVSALVRDDTVDDLARRCAGGLFVEQDRRPGQRF